MGKCRYCGTKSMLIIHECKSCKEKRTKGKNILYDAINNWFVDMSAKSLTAGSAVNSGQQIVDNNFVALVSSLVASYSLDNAERNAALQNSIINNTMLALVGTTKLENAVEKIKTCAQAFGIPPANLKQMIMTGMEHSVDRILEDNYFSEEEESRFGYFYQAFGITEQERRSMPAFELLLKASILRDVYEGEFRAKVNYAGFPFNLQKGEKLLWVFQDAVLLESKTKTRTRYVGSSGGLAFEVMRGVYIGSRSFRSEPIDYDETKTTWTPGVMGVTQKHIYFFNPAKSIRIPYAKIVSFMAYSDGIGLQRDSISAGPMAIITGDGWFTNNLIAGITAHV